MDADLRRHDGWGMDADLRRHDGWGMDADLRRHDGWMAACPSLACSLARHDGWMPDGVHGVVLTDQVAL
jgi:hypothetical protein